MKELESFNKLNFPLNLISFTIDMEKFPSISARTCENINHIIESWLPAIVIGKALREVTSLEGESEGGELLLTYKNIN